MACLNLRKSFTKCSLLRAWDTNAVFTKKQKSQKISTQVVAGVNLYFNQADGPVITIHDLPQDVSLDGLKKHVRMKVPGACLKAGFFWMNSKGKQLHVLNSDQDLSEAKCTGEQGTMRLAIVVDSGMNAVFAKILKILQFLE